LRNARVTLEVHPLFGQELGVRSSYGTNGVWAETADGKRRLLPLAWTSLRPRREPLELEGQAVRLAPNALLELAGWVAARAGGSTPSFGEKVAVEIGPDDNKEDVQTTRRGADTAAAMVGKARSPGSCSRVKRGDGGRR